MLAAIVCVSCNEIQNVLDESLGAKKGYELTVSGLTSDDGYKTMRFGIVDTDCSPYDLSNKSQVKTSVVETYDRVLRLKGSMQPRLINVENERVKLIDSLRLGLYLVVDVTLPQEVLNSIRSDIEYLWSFFDNEMFVSFMSGSGSTEFMPLSTYVLDNYLVAADVDEKMLYKTVIEKIEELNSTTQDCAFSDFDHVTLLVISDGILYDFDNYPLDPDHFANSQRVVSLASDINSNFKFYYYAVPDKNNSDVGDADELMQLSAKRYHGNFVKKETTSIGVLFRNLMSDFNIIDVDYIITVENPAGKTYRGSQSVLTVEFFNGNEKIAGGSCEYVIGDFASPVIVADPEGKSAVMIGVSCCLFVLLIVFLVLQVLVPYIQYQLFLRKNVFKYQGPNMAVNGHVIGETCYLCKGNFEVGDSVVAKCKHSMHLDCWNENGYKCPEHGPRCPEGSHYYNKKNLMDPRNGYYYTWWIIFAIFGTIVAWLINTEWFHELTALFVTTGMCWLSRGTEWLSRRLAHSVLFGVIAMIAVAGIFELYMQVSSTVGFGDAIYIGWAPRTLMMLVMLYCSTSFNWKVFNNVTLLTAVIVGLVELGLWSIMAMDYSWNSQVARLVVVSIISIVVAVFSVRVHPKSTRYFLHIEGPVKTMDIALYKIFSTLGEKREMTIGRSVDCSLQLSWDLQSDIAPIQARIIERKGYLSLEVVDGQVFRKDKPITAGKRFDLFNGLSFTIGKTKFTYIEKDIRFNV